MKELAGIAFDSKVMGGKPGTRGTRVTVGTVVGLHLEKEGLQEALAYAARLVSGGF